MVHSVVNGRLLMRYRELLTLDEAAIVREAREIAGHIAKIAGRR